MVVLIMSDKDIKPQRKILVLGGILSTDRVCSHRWDHIPQDLNVADFDTVILDFTPFELYEIAKNIDIDAVPSFQQFARLLFSTASEIIVIGKPFFKLGNNPYLEPIWWLPLTPKFLARLYELL